MNNPPRLILAGLSGGAGKTIVSLGLTRALARSGLKVKAFKKGPDYIDATWLGLAAGAAASNLDPFLMPADTMASLFVEKSQHADIAIIEGNRGLFDGKDVHGSCSTSELARAINTPVVLILDATKMTRTAAAIIKGCMEFEQDFTLSGVILNRTAGDRHRSMLRECIAEYTGLPVLGELPKLVDNPIPERHMGLISNREYGQTDAILEQLADIADEYLDVPGLKQLAELAGMQPVSTSTSPLWPESGDEEDDEPLIIGFVRDEAFWFYYEENLDALAHAGAELVELSLTDGKKWPDIHGLYIGGGFPETLAEQLSAQSSARQRVRMLSELGLPIYAECGGFMYLGDSIIMDGKRHPMAGVFPVHTEFCPKPQGLGYVEATVILDNPFIPKGRVIQGHEFHYSRCVAADGSVVNLGLKIDRGQGMIAGFDGLIHKNTFATYIHTHALGVTEWAPNFVAAAKAFRAGTVKK